MSTETTTTSATTASDTGGDGIDPPIFDTHAHIISGDVERYPLAEAYRDASVEIFSVEDLLAGMGEQHVPKACVVQRWFQYRDDNSYVLDACGEHPDRLLPVIMLYGQDPASVTRLRAYAERQRIGGIRFTRPELDVEDTGWMNAPQTMQLWELAAELRLPVCFIMFDAHIDFNLPAAQRIAERFPELPILIDHLGVRIEPGATAGERPHDFAVSPALREIAGCPNVHFKFTGINLGRLADAGVDAAVFLRSFADEFGVDRIVLGSDIGQTKGPYARITTGLRDALRLFDARDRQAIGFDNAARIYDPGGTP
jgi:L-fuconolactonase